MTRSRLPITNPANFLEDRFWPARTKRRRVFGITSALPTIHQEKR